MIRVDGMLASRAALRSLVPALLLGASLRADVVVEKAGAPGAPAPSGLEQGDVLVSWSVEPRKDVPGPAARGTLESPFDLAAVEVEEAPRGVVTISYRRNGAAASARLAVDSWSLAVRPAFPGPDLARYREGKDAVDAKEAAKGTGIWDALADHLEEGGRFADSAWLRVKAAEALARTKDAAGRRRELARAAAAAEKSRSPSLRAAVKVSEGDAAKSPSEAAEAEAAYRAALAIEEERAPDSLAVATVKARLARLADERSDIDAAEELYRAVLKIRERLAPGSLALAAAWNAVGASSIRRGDLNQAETYVRRSLALREKLAPGGREVVNSLANLGMIERDRGNLELAERLSRQALAVTEKLAPDSVEVANRLNSLALLAKARTDFAAAEAYSKRALAIFEREGSETLPVAGMLNNMGNIAVESGDVLAAEPYYRRALAIREKLAPESLDTAGSYNNLARVLLERKEYDAAEEQLRRAVAIKERLAPSSLTLATSFDALGNVSYERLDYPKAVELHKKGLAIRQALAPSGPAEAMSQLNLGLDFQRSRRLRDARECFSRVVEIVEGERGRLGGSAVSRSGFAAQFARAYQNLAEILVGEGKPEEAFAVVERGRAQSLVELFSSRDLTFGSEVPEELGRRIRRIANEYDNVMGQIARSSAEKDKEAVKASLDRLATLRAKRAEAEAEILKAAPRLAPVVRPESLDAAGVRNLLDPGTLLLEYGVGEGSTSLLFAASRGGLTVHTLNAGAESLPREVELFRSLLLRGREVTRPEPALLSQGARLYDLLLRPAAQEIARAERVVIVPDGVLHTLPFAALVAEGKPAGAPRYFIEERPISIVGSAALLAELRSSRRAPGPRSSPELVAFGDPAYRRLSPDSDLSTSVPAAVRQGSTLEPLPFSREEVKGIAALFPGRADVRLGKDATEEGAKAVGKGPRFLHFACHAIVDGRVPSESALALAAPSDDSARKENGFLQAWEVFEGMRIDADLVVLSSCETGLLQERSGEGLLGLVRSFQLAGAKGVVASLWSVSDRSTALLMRRFYEALRDGTPGDEALREAQLSLLSREGAEAHPYRWAAFELMGDGR